MGATREWVAGRRKFDQRALVWTRADSGRAATGPDRAVGSRSSAASRDAAGIDCCGLNVRGAHKRPLTSSM